MRTQWSLAVGIVVTGLWLSCAFGEDVPLNFPPVANTDPNVMSFRTYCAPSATPASCTQLVNAVPSQRQPEFAVLSTGTALTPVPLWPTPTAGATPAATPPTFDTCEVRNPSSNTTDVWLCSPDVTVCVPQTTSGTPGPVNGIRLRPGEAIVGLPAITGGCGGYTIVSDGATVRFERVRQ